MKALLLLLSLLAVGVAGAWVLADKPPRPRPGWCSPYAEKCPSCTNCRYCKHCAKDKGKCSVCWDLKDPPVKPPK